MFESIALPVEEQDLDEGDVANDGGGNGAHSGGLVVPMVGGEPRLNKPPLIYWLQSASAWVMTGGDPSRDAIWMYRLPSLIASIITVLITWRIGISMFDGRKGKKGKVGWFAGVFVGVSPVFVWEAHQARADQVLVAFTTLAMWGLWETVKGGMHARENDEGRDGSTDSNARVMGWVWPAVLWVGISGGVMTKGPITPMVVGLCLVAMCVCSRRWTPIVRTRPVLGVLFVTSVGLPWVIAVAQRVGWETYIDTIKAETFGRAGSVMEGHWGPPGYHLALLFVLFWPGSLMTILGVFRAFQRGVKLESMRGNDSRVVRTWRRLVAIRPARRAEFFCLAWIVPSWIVFELVSTKLPHYTMPLYPAIALLSSRAMLAAAAGSLPIVSSRLARHGHRIWIGIGLAVCVAAPVALLVFACEDGSCSIFVLVMTVAVAVAANVLLLLAGRAMRQANWYEVQRLGIAAALTLAAVVGLTLPRMDIAFISPKIMEAIDIVDPDGSRPVAIIDFHEDSLTFLSRGSIDMIDGQAVPAWIEAHPDGLLWAPPQWAQRWADDPVIGLVQSTPSTEVSGFNYSQGRSVVLRLYTAGP